MIKLSEASVNNPFSKWIDIYSSEGFEEVVNEALVVFDELANQTTKKLQNKMLEAFHTSTALEWHFWNDAYNQNEFDSLVIY